MRLMVHNLLQCHKPNCQNKSFPLSITKARVEEKEIDYQPAFIQGLMTKIDWNALKAAATEVGIDVSSLPHESPDEVSEDLAKTLHHLLMETQVMEGELLCPNCGRVYPVKDGIPNMLLKEDEI